MNRSVLGAAVRPSGHGEVVAFQIDGVDIFDALGLRAKEWRRPPRAAVAPPSDHLLGGPDRWEDPQDPWFDDGMVAIAGCICGQPGCSAVLMRVTVNRTDITWSTFRLHNSGESIDAEFHFNPRQYRAALARIAQGDT